jgi:hypothetical protein
MSDDFADCDWVDVAWYALDAQECVAEFTTAGFSPLPGQLAVQIERLAAAERLVRNELPRRSQVTIDETWKHYVKLSRGMRDTEQRYLESARESAERGLFTFDAIVRNPKPTDYFRVGVQARRSTFQTCPPKSRRSPASASCAMRRLPIRSSLP